LHEVKCNKGTRNTGDLALLQRRVAVAAYWGNFSGKAEMRWIYENQN